MKKNRLLTHLKAYCLNVVFCPNGNVFSYQMAKNMYDFDNHPVVAVCWRKKLESLGRVFFSARKIFKTRHSIFDTLANRLMIYQGHKITFSNQHTHLIFFVVILPFEEKRSFLLVQIWRSIWLIRSPLPMEKRDFQWPK